jgi:hypothetical protein
VGGDGGGVSNGPPIDLLGGRWVVMGVSNIDILYTLDSASNYSTIKKLKP